MSNWPLISVIVPVYNTERFLPKCLDSIMSQTYREIEVIVVDDGSLGNVRDIVEGYRRVYDSIKLVSHDKNRGLFQARITGVSKSSGEYIAFVDSDDSISVDFFRSLVKKAVDTGADMVCADYAFEYEDGRREYSNLDNLRLLDLDLKAEQVFETFIRQEGLCFSWHVVWNKLYKKTLWDECAPYFKRITNHLVMTEDIAFSSVFWSLARHVVNIHNVLYFYAQHDEQSVKFAGSLDKFKKYAGNVGDVFLFFENIMRECGTYDKYAEHFLAWKQQYTDIWWYNSLALVSRPDMADAEKFITQALGLKKSVPVKDYTFFNSLRTNLDPAFDWYETIKKDISSDETEYVSFDIFDTLVVRPFLEPSDLFHLLDIYFNEITKTSSFVQFVGIRYEAEAECRRQMHIEYPLFEDVTLDEIYDFIGEKYKIPSQVLELVKNKELELERHFCRTRECGKDLFELAEYADKPIILISDMYLPKNSVQEILNNCGYYNYKHLFLSSSERLLKGSSNLFKKALDTIGVDAGHAFRVCHIGDNWQSDMVTAGKLGFKAHFLPSVSVMFKENNPGIYSGRWFTRLYQSSQGIEDHSHGISKHIAMSCILGLAAIKRFDNPFISPTNSLSDFNANPNYIGYTLLGPHLYAVADWILQEVGHDNSNTVHFTSRDGYVLKQVFDILSGADSKRSNYIYTSRKSLAPLDIETILDFNSVIEKYSVHALSPKKFIHDMKKLVIPEKLDDAAKLCLQSGFVWEKPFGLRSEFARFTEFFVKILYDEQAHLIYREKIKNYFSEIIKPGDTIFDMGYSGRGEAALSHLLGRPIKSLYIHSNGDKLSLRAHLENFNVKCFYDFSPKACVVIREHVFSEIAPSCVGYDTSSDQETVLPVFEEDYENDYYTYFITKLMQDSAIEFASDFKKTFDGYLAGFKIPYLTASMPFEYFLHYPTDFDTYIFAKSNFEDDAFGGSKEINMAEYWKQNINEKHLNESINITYTGERVVTRIETVVRTAEIPTIPPELQVVASSESYLRLINKLDKWFPKGGKKRKLMKMLIRFFKL